MILSPRDNSVVFRYCASIRCYFKVQRLVINVKTVVLLTKSKNEEGCSLCTILPDCWFPRDMISLHGFKPGRWWCHPQTSHQSCLHVGDCSCGCTAWTGWGWAHSPGGLRCWALEWRRCDHQSHLKQEQLTRNLKQAKLKPGCTSLKYVTLNHKSQSKWIWSIWCMMPVFLVVAGVFITKPSYQYRSDKPPQPFPVDWPILLICSVTRDQRGYESCFLHKGHPSIFLWCSVLLYFCYYLLTKEGFSVTLLQSACSISYYTKGSVESSYFCRGDYPEIHFLSELSTI